MSTIVNCALLATASVLALGASAHAADCIVVSVDPDAPVAASSGHAATPEAAQRTAIAAACHAAGEDDVARCRDRRLLEVRQHEVVGRVETGRAKATVVVGARPLAVALGHGADLPAACTAAFAKTCASFGARSGGCMGDRVDWQRLMLDVPEGRDPWVCAAHWETPPAQATYRAEGRAKTQAGATERVTAALRAQLPADVVGRFDQIVAAAGAGAGGGDGGSGDWGLARASELRIVNGVSIVTLTWTLSQMRPPVVTRGVGATRAAACHAAEAAACKAVGVTACPVADGLGGFFAFATRRE